MVNSVASVRLPLQRLLDVSCGALLGASVAILIAEASGRPSAPAPSAVTTPSPAPGVAARALAVIDGDTFEARVSVFPGQEIVTRVRIAGLDAPERASRCAGEREAAEAATAALSRLIEGRRLTLTAVRGDKYFGRVLARVSTAEASDVAEALIGDGHGRAYAGGKRGGWC